MVDAIVHAYDFSEQNVQDNRIARATHAGIWEGVRAALPKDRVLPREIAVADWPIEVTTETIFRESGTDFAAHHNLRLDSWFHDGLVSREKNAEAARRWPQRYFPYVGVDPTQGVDRCIAEMREQVAETPNAVGLKLYPHRIYPFESWRMDDPAVAYPLFEEAAHLGIKVVAIHKALPLGPVPMDPYRVSDLDGAAMNFPEMNFEIIHSGMAFVEETAWAIARFPNVYANLEATTWMGVHHPRRLAETLAALMSQGGFNKLLYAGTLPILDCQFLLESFVSLEFPEDVVERYGFEFTRDLKEGILGLNYLEMVGVDPEEAKARIADDEFSEFNDGTKLDPWGTRWGLVGGAEVSA
ncbi:amidohydrolase family protein [Streptomyces sp. NPDC047081]|uniref:amidohydrolase family protein n=1 Tax=Streptomyces sp. NPDC047081 TaxID=3154706 RepID=UPI003408EF35